MATDDRAQTMLILDLSVSTDQYISDHRAQSLVAQLQAAGASVVVARGVVAGADDLAALTGFVSQRAYASVVMLHAWNDRLIHAVRAGMRDTGRLIRLTDGVRAALDSEFDFVVDDNELLGLIAGVLPDIGGAWKPTSAKELRSRGPDRRGENPGTVVEWVSLHGDEAPSRPTISGPSAGCPFLLDTRVNAIYDDVEMDPEQVQTRGCSFCLDNFGAYTVSSETDTIESWLSQIRTIRAQRPDVREFLLTDERPHPFLPAFFRAIAADPAMAPIELLIKSRIDWLLEYADGALSDAAATAAEHGDVLHVYLIGFENFDQFHLDLFNKGVDVADNIAAISKIRELGKRFPESLEYRRLRAHGFVLFTPWTRPEHLVTNARVMREVGFDEFRADPLDTRLRLYPRVPLHSKAEQEGLLLESFPSGRPDRAGEQGYDASVAWRFADGRTEAVFRLCRALTSHAHSPLLEDADFLELAARFVMRWPGLAEAPDLAHLAFVSVVGNLAQPGLGRHIREMIDLDATDQPLFDTELEAIQAGLKRVALKEGIPPDKAAALTDAYRAMGFAAGIAGRQGAGLDSGSGAVDESRTRMIVAVAADEASLAEVIALNAVIHERRPGRGQAVERIGELLGYPPCCVAAFASLDDQGDNLQLERRPFLRAADAVLDLRNNRLAIEAPLLSHHICRPDCSASALIGETLLNRLAEASPAAARWTRERLSRDRLVFGYDAQVELTGSIDDDGRYRIESTKALGNSARAELWSRTVSFTIDADGIDLELSDGSRTRIPAAQPLLITPGRPLPSCALAAISRTSSLAPEKPSSSQSDRFETPSARRSDESSAAALSVDQAEAFLAACFGSSNTPIELAGEVAVVASAPTRSKCGFDLELTDRRGNHLKAYVVRSRPGEPAYTSSEFMSLAYYGNAEDSGAPGAADLERIMTAVRDALLAGETRLGKSAVDALFTPTNA